VDNAVDEALAGYCDSIKVILHSNGSCSVAQPGAGSPWDIHKESGKPRAEVVLTVLHSGGKFEHSAYKVSGGLQRRRHLGRERPREWLEIEDPPRRPRLDPALPVGVLRTTHAREKTTKHGTIGALSSRSPKILRRRAFSFDTLSSTARAGLLNKGLKIGIEDERDERSTAFLYRAHHRVHQASQPDQDADHPKCCSSEGKKAARVGGRAAVQRRLQEKVVGYKSINHGRRHAPHGVPGGAHRDDLGLRQANGFLKTFKGDVSGDDVREA